MEPRRDTHMVQSREFDQMGLQTLLQETCRKEQSPGKYREEAYKEKYFVEEARY